MKKIAVHIPTFEAHKYFYKVANNFLDSTTYQVDLFIYTVQPMDNFKLNMNDCKLHKPYHGNINLTQFTPSIKQDLTFRCYDKIIEDKNKYDLFIYCEDDMLIRESVIDTFLKENKKLNDNEVIGLLRYELFMGGKYLTEFNSITSHIHSLEPIMKQINDEWYFSTQNVHQGCWILEKRNLNQLIENNKFIFKWGELSKFNELLSEDAASNVYKSDTWPGTTKGLSRYIPVKKIDDLLIHHLSNKYVQSYDEIWPVSKLKEKVK